MYLAPKGTPPCPGAQGDLQFQQKWCYCHAAHSTVRSQKRASGAICPGGPGHSGVGTSKTQEQAEFVWGWMNVKYTQPQAGGPSSLTDKQLCLLQLLSEMWSGLTIPLEPPAPWSPWQACRNTTRSRAMKSSPPLLTGPAAPSRPDSWVTPSSPHRPLTPRAHLSPSRNSSSAGGSAWWRAGRCVCCLLVSPMLQNPAGRPPMVGPRGWSTSGSEYLFLLAGYLLDP